MVQLDSVSAFKASLQLVYVITVPVLPVCPQMSKMFALLFQYLASHLSNEHHCGFEMLLAGFYTSLVSV